MSEATSGMNKSLKGGFMHSRLLGTSPECSSSNLDRLKKTGLVVQLEHSLVLRASKQIVL